MSLATDLTNGHLRMAEAEKRLSGELRKLRAIAPAAIYNEAMLQLSIVASELNALKANLGAMRMLGELEQRPPPVTTESLELAQCLSLSTLKREQPTAVPMLPRHAIRDESERFKRELEHIGDDTLRDDLSDLNDRVDGEMEGRAAA